ncbi:MAG: hypothetical protein WA964_07815 [Ilumatobacter sp.]|uniref:hypothetical protein n=1 Tax=Ilumatobacter sp. TaxID=1967498 RepID=UPI003C775DBD
MTTDATGTGTGTGTGTEPYVRVGRSGLFVDRVGLGTMQFGWSVDETGAFDVLDAYAELSGNFET